VAREVSSVVGQFWRDEFSLSAPPFVNDPRIVSEATLTELFNSELGYQHPLIVNDFDLIVDTSVDGLWDSFAETYLIAFLERGPLGRLESRMKALFTDLQSALGSLQFPLPMSQFTVLKCP